MRENSTVFFFAISETEHTSHIKLQFLKICVLAVTANFFSVKIMICAFYDFPDLRISGNISNNRENMACEHHTHLFMVESFHCLSLIMVIAVLPSFFAVFAINPFL